MAGYSQSASKESSCDSCFLQDFVSFLVNNVDNPMWLFEVLKEVFNGVLSTFLSILGVLSTCVGPNGVRPKRKKVERRELR